MADRFLITAGGTVNWNDNNSWSASSGGATGASFPLVGDNAFLDANSGAGTLTVNTGSACTDLDCTGFTGTLNIASSFTVRGSLTFVAGMALAGTSTITFDATSAKTITTGGKTLDNGLAFNGAGGSWQLQDALTTGATRDSTLLNGTLDINGEILTTGRFIATPTVGEIKSTAAGGKIVTTSTAAGQQFLVASACTVTRNSWTIEIGGNTTNARAVSISFKTMPALTFTNTTPDGTLQFTGSNTYKSISVAVPPQTLAFAAGTTTTIEDDNGFPSGTPGNLVTIGSITAASHTLTKSGNTGAGDVLVDYLSISRSSATPGRTWLAGDNSVDDGNNSGWIFSSELPPALMFLPRFL